MKKKLTHRELFDKQQQELSDFPIAYAFNKQQLKEALMKLGAKDVSECVTYFRIALLDAAYKIIANGGESTVYHRGDIYPLTIKNEIGMCTIMPIRRDWEDKDLDSDKIIVELDDILKGENNV